MTHHLYIIAHRHAEKLVKPVKVGITSNLKARIRAVQTGNPAPVEFAFVFDFPNADIARSMELAFHNLQKEDRLTGEWFNIDVARALRLFCLYLDIAIQINLGDDEDPDAQMVRQLSGLNDALTLLRSLTDGEEACQ